VSIFGGLTVLMILTAVTIKSRFINNDGNRGFQAKFYKACPDDFMVIKSKLALGFSTFDYLTVVENTHGIVALMGLLIELALYQIHLPALGGEFK
jgi:hypothetical protein